MNPLIFCGILTALLLPVGFFILGPRIADSVLNKKKGNYKTPVSEFARKLHSSLLVVDLHSDFLLWKRDLLKRYSRGHVDLPRLKQGNMALQVFSAVTSVPRKLNYERNESGSDIISFLAVSQLWPLRTWQSLCERALHQASCLKDAAKRSHGSFTIIQSKTDLDLFLDRRDASEKIIAGILSIEGLHALDGKLDNVDRLFEAGFRMMAPVHMTDNNVGGSAHGFKKGGLTDFGKKILERMEEMSIIVDLAHTSQRTFDDILQLSNRPVLVSHTGIQATCPGPRNLSDEQLLGIARGGGIVGIGFWNEAVCGTRMIDIIRSIHYASELIGANNVSLGSDFDGTVSISFDSSDMALITEGLLDDGLSMSDIKNIMGLNAIRFIRALLPS